MCVAHDARCADLIPSDANLVYYHCVYMPILLYRSMPLYTCTSLCLQFGERCPLKRNVDFLVHVQHVHFPVYGWFQEVCVFR